MLVGTLAVLAGMCSIAPHAIGLTETGSVDGIEYAVYAPDWTWQKRDVNILVVLENSGSEPAEVTLDLVFPPGKESHFQYEANGDELNPTRVEVTVPAGGTARRAYTNIRALDGVPRQTYQFELLIRVGGRVARVAYPVRTIRGAMVSPGKWALLAPGAVALAWCIVFALAATRFASARAWRTPSTPIDEPEQAEPWIDLEPTE